MSFSTKSAIATTAPQSARIIWHFGFQKTGTTAIQSVCWRNLKTLSSATALFPKRHWTRDLRAAAVGWLDGGGTAQNVIGAAMALADQIANSPHETALVSDENILGFDIYNSHGDIFDFATRILPLVEQAAHPNISEFVFYIRDMETWLRSAHAQSVAWRRQVLDYDSWRAGIPFDTNWDVQHARLQATVGGRVIFRDMGQDSDEYDLLGGYLMERAGIPRGIQSNLTQARAGNERMNRGAQELMLELNRSRLNDKNLNIVRRTVLRNMHVFQSKTEN